MSNNRDFNLIDEMARGCLYRGGASEDAFLRGYAHGAMVYIGILVVGYGIEVFLKWIYS